MTKAIRICFMADRHHLYDDRIYWKMAVPLIERGFEVHYLLIGDKNDAGLTSEGVHFKMFKVKTFSTNRFLNFALKRLNRQNNYKLLYKEAALLKADIYHFHDLWLNRIGPQLKRLPHKPVIFYDAREPYQQDYISYVKSSVPFMIKLFAAYVNRWEKKQAKHYDLVIANEAIVQEHFAKAIGADRSVVLYNYSDQLDRYDPVPFNRKKYDLIYSGAITELRGAYEMLTAVEKMRLTLPSVRALLIGNYYPASLQNELQRYIEEHDLKDQVELKNAVPYEQMATYYNTSKIGMVLLHPVKTFEISMPIKLFEYMAFGLPVIGSDFGHIEAFIREDQCGFSVPPFDTDAIAKAAIRILTDIDLYKSFSENGRKISCEKYRWDKEFEKLLSYYKNALDAR